MRGDATAVLAAPQMLRRGRPVLSIRFRLSDLSMNNLACKVRLAQKSMQALHLDSGLEANNFIAIKNASVKNQ
jgi:hypothetical protein